MKNMIVNNNTKKIKCDMAGCKNTADYTIECRRGLRGSGLYMCSTCMKDMYHAIGKIIVPKSPVNILNIDKKKEKKNEKNK